MSILFSGFLRTSSKFLVERFGFNKKIGQVAIGGLGDPFLGHCLATLETWMKSFEALVVTLFVPNITSSATLQHNDHNFYKKELEVNISWEKKN